MNNLNNLLITNADGSDLPLQDFSNKIENPKFDNVEVVFKEIEKRLIELILEHKKGLIFGCVAWLTSASILNALSKCDNVQIILQKEDFLRPDSNSKGDWIKEIRKMYNNLTFSFYRDELKYPISYLSFCVQDLVDSLRCVGNHNADKVPAFPRMHNKFLVFCKFEQSEKDSIEINYKPVAVWTGSFNFTYNATNSFENAVILSDTSGDNTIINSFLKEHHQIFTLSEPLNWESEWVQPEFRLGT
jgi:hypothetical protein